MPKNGVPQIDASVKRMDLTAGIFVGSDNKEQCENVLEDDSDDEINNEEGDDDDDDDHDDVNDL